jgi:hypothetical protein
MPFLTEHPMNKFQVDFVADGQLSELKTPRMGIKGSLSVLISTVY